MASDTIEKGDIVWLEYDAYTVNPNGTQTLFDTTHEEVAKKEDKFEEKKVYAEQPVIVGKDRMFKGLEEALIAARVGDAREVTIAPDKGAGPRDPRMVELRTEREFLRQEINPELGMEVSVSGRRGTITSVAAGRVRVDFNNPLAGKTLKYVVKVTKKATTTEEKVRAVLDMDYGLGDQFKIQLSGEEAEIRVPDVCKTDEKWFVSKFRVVADLRDVADLRLMRFVEEYEKKKEEPKKEEAVATAGAEGRPAAVEEPKKEAPAKKAGGKKARQPKPKPAEAPAPEELPKEEKAPEEL